MATLKEKMEFVSEAMYLRNCIENLGYVMAKEQKRLDGYKAKLNEIEAICGEA